MIAKCGLRLKAQDWPIYAWRKFTEWLDGGRGRLFYRDEDHARAHAMRCVVHIEDSAERDLARSWIRDEMLPRITRALERGAGR